MQLQEGLNDFFRQSEADSVMLVQPLDRPDSSQTPRQVDADGNVMTGIISGSSRNRIEDFAAFLRRGGLRADLSGSVGDCCDETANLVSQVNTQIDKIVSIKYMLYLVFHLHLWLRPTHSDHQSAYSLFQLVVRKECLSQFIVFHSKIPW